MKADQFLALERTIKSLRESYDNYLKVIEKPTCDKHAFKFGSDGRFSSFKTTVILETYTGYYGNSSCSTFLHFPDEKVVVDAFQAYLNHNMHTILYWMADHIEQKAEVKKEEYIKSLKAELARLEESEVLA